MSANGDFATVEGAIGFSLISERGEPALLRGAKLY
jgi:hypothetical protein